MRRINWSRIIITIGVTTFFYLIIYHKYIIAYFMETIGQG